MGYDLYGENPQNKQGEYFRNNVWWWGPLWRYVAHTCSDLLSDEDLTAGSFNDGHVIDEEQAEAIATRLYALLESGEVTRYRLELEGRCARMADEPCTLCAGTGKRRPPPEVGAGDWPCNGCEGKGVREPMGKYQPFDEENVRTFADFCYDSGGFSIS